MLVAEIDPKDLVRVRYSHGGTTREIVAFSVSLVPVHLKGTNRRVIVTELLFDPNLQSPSEPYVTGQYERLLLFSRAIKSVKPYIG